MADPVPLQVSDKRLFLIKDTPWDVLNENLRRPLMGLACNACNGDTLVSTWYFPVSPARPNLALGPCFWAMCIEAEKRNGGEARWREGKGERGGQRRETIFIRDAEVGQCNKHGGGIDKWHGCFSGGCEVDLGFSTWSQFVCIWKVSIVSSIFQAQARDVQDQSVSLRNILQEEFSSNSSFISQAFKHLAQVYKVRKFDYPTINETVRSSSQFFIKRNLEIQLTFL